MADTRVTVTLLSGLFGAGKSTLLNPDQRRNPLPMKPSVLASAAVLLLTAGASANDHEARHWRLFVADHEAPVVSAVELEDGSVAGRFELTSPAALSIGKSGRTVFAAQRDGDAVAVIATGITVEDHGDHGDLKVEAPALLPVTIAGDKPVHVVSHDGKVAVFFDDEGIARVANEKDLLAGQGATSSVDTGAPHHGVVAPFAGHMLVSVPHPTDPKALPGAIRVVAADGSAVGEDHVCPDLHGEATSGPLLAFACAKGLLIASAGMGVPSVDFLPYAADLGEGKATTLLGGTGMTYFVGNFGPKALVVIDPSAGEAAFRKIDLPVRRVHFAAAPEMPRFVFVFTEDGKLAKVDILKAEIAGSVQVTEAYSMDGEWGLPRPRIAVAGQHVIVTDPFKGVLHVIDGETLQIQRQITVPGKPYNIVSVGGAGHEH